MHHDLKTLRVLHSFPHRLGKQRICTTAWYEVDKTAAAGAELVVLAGDSVRPFPNPVQVHTTLSRGKLRVPYRLLGGPRACILHDWIVARKLPYFAGKVDIIHAWPQGALRTIQVAKRLGIPVALERCNAHTRFAYEIVEKESRRLSVALPCNYEHAYNAKVLRREEQEYALAAALLCPSDFVVKTFMDQGFPRERLVRFFYGVDETLFYPSHEQRGPNRELTMMFAGICAVRKGLHYALEAWIQSPASQHGRFLIAGDFLPDYRKRLEPLLSHPSVHLLGHRKDIPELMRQSDLFVLPSIEEGFGLVCTEAMASGCVPLVSEACTELCVHMKNAMVHPIGDVESLTEHITILHEDRALLEKIRDEGLHSIPGITWNAAGKSLINAYREVISNYSR